MNERTIVEMVNPYPKIVYILWLFVTLKTAKILFPVPSAAVVHFFKKSKKICLESSRH